MLSRIRQSLAPPIFEDAEQNRVARWLYAILATMLVAAGAGAMVNVLTGHLKIAYVLIAGTAVSLGALWLAKRGHLSASGFLFLLTLLGVTNYLLLTGQGIHDTAVMLYPVTIIAASLLLGKRGFVTFSLLTVSSACGVVVSEMAGWIHTAYTDLTYYDDLVVVLVILIATAIVVRLLAADLVRGLRLAQRNERALEETNRQLGLQTKALREGEERYRLLFECANDAIFLENERDEIVDVNRRACELLGYTRQELLSMKVADIQATEARGLPGNVIRDEWTQHGNAAFESVDLHREGKRIPVEVSLSELPSQGERLMLSIVRDITERKRAEQVQAALYRISEAAQTAQDLNELFASIHAIIGELMPAKSFFIALYDASTDVFTFPYHADELDTDWSPIRPGKSLTGYVLRTGKPLLTTPSVFDQLVASGQVELFGAPSVDWLGVPLNTEHGTIGVMVIQTYTTEAHLTEADKDVLVFVSTQAAMAIERKQAEEEIARLAKFPSENPNPILRLSQAGIVLYANEASAPLLQEWGCIVGGCAPEAWRHLIAEAFTHGLSRTVGVESQERAYSFVVVPITEVGYVNLYGTDITDRKLAEEALAHERALLRAVIDLVPDSIYAKDTECRKTLANLADVRHMGVRSEADALGKTDFDFFSHDAAAKLYADDQQVIQTGHPLINREETIATGDGQLTWLLTSKVPLRNSDGEVVGLVGVGRDITERKHAEEALRRSQSLTLAIVENLPFEFWACGADGRYVMQNAPDINLWGNLVGKTLEETGLPEDELVVWQANHRRAFAGEFVYGEYERIIKGEKRNYYSLIGPIRDGDAIRGILGIRIDITDRKRAEEQVGKLNRTLRVINEVNQTLVRAADESELLQRACEIIIGVGGYRLAWVGFAEQDEAKTVRPVAANDITTDANYDPWRDEALRRGYASSIALPLISGDEALGALNIYAAEPNAFDEAEIKLLAEMADDLAYGITALRTRAARMQAENEIKRLNQDLDRRARGLAALNKAGQIMASTLDLDTLLNRMLEQVQELLDAEGVSVLLCEQVEGQIPTGQLVFSAATGRSAQDLIGIRLPAETGVAGWVVREKQSVLVADVHSDARFNDKVDAVTGMSTHSLLAVPLLFKGAVLGLVEAVNKINGTFDRHDLEVLEALSNSAAIAIENAQMFATEQQRATALAQALEQQRQLDRIQREFIQNVSHELRTPLALVRGHAELLESGWLGELPPEQKESVGVIARRAQMLSKLVDDIISVLEIEQRQLRRERVDLTALARAALADFTLAAQEAGLALSAELASDVPLVDGDPTALRRALDNLVHNALKFTPAGGHVTIRLFQNVNSVLLQVSDTGIGIPADQLERVFERFYQVDGSTTRVYGGVGLGLSLVKGIVEAHGGYVTVESQVGVGSTFTILLSAA